MIRLCRHHQAASKCLRTSPLHQRLSSTANLANKTQQSLQAQPTIQPDETMYKSKWHGSEHWLLERYYSILLIPSIATALVFGPVTINDYLLGVLIPLHVHLGFDTMITDYIPSRKNARANSISRWTLRVVTGLTLYSLFVFNTMDVGITSFIQRLWTGKSSRVLVLNKEEE